MHGRKASSPQVEPPMNRHGSGGPLATGQPSSVRVGPRLAQDGSTRPSLTRRQKRLLVAG